MAKDETWLNRSAVIRSLSGVVAVVAVVFICAGTWRYWQGILYCSLMLSLLIVSASAIAQNPELINERLKPGKGTKQWDIVYWRLSTSLFFITLSLSALDSGRLHWSPELPAALYVIASVLYTVGYLIFLWARRANNFFSSVVRIQKDRGQTVVQDGPYRYIRHPGYVGGLLYTSVTPLLFGSLWGLIPAGIAVVLLLIRAYLEDETLADELEGYREYKARVRYRLVPYVW